MWSSPNSDTSVVLAPFWRILTLELAIPLIIGREAFPRPVEEIPGRSFNISPIEYFLLFSTSWPSNKILPLSLSYSVVGLSLEVTNTSGTMNIDSNLSANTMLGINTKVDRYEIFFNNLNLHS